MEQQVQTVLAKFDTKQTRSGWLYKAFDQYGTEYSTFRQAIWESAKAFTGLPVQVTYTTKTSPDGRFEDRYLENVEPANGPVAVQPLPNAPNPNLAPAQANVFVQAEQPTVQPTAVPVATVEYQRAKHPD